MSNNWGSRQGFTPIPNGNQMGDSSMNIPLNPMQPGSTSVSTPQAGSAEKRRTIGHRRKLVAKQRQEGQVGADGEEDTLNAVGRFYQRFLAFSIITRYLVYVAPLALMVAIPIIVGATIAPNATLAGVSLRWFFVWIEVVWLSVWVSKIVVHFLPGIFQILAGVVSSGTRKYALVIRSLEIPLSLVGWSVTSLATFVPIMTKNPWNVKNKMTDKQDWETIVQKILGACVVSTLVYLVEKLFIQLISINYHRKQFNAKIRASKRNVYLLGLLYEASRNLFPMYCVEFAEDDYTIADQLNIARLGSKFSRGHHRTGSVTPFRLLQDVGRFGDKVTSVFGNVAHEITGKQVFNPNSAHSIVVEALERTKACEALAKRIWTSFVIEGKEELYLEDVLDVLGHDHEEEAEEAFLAIDRDGNGDISLDEMILTVTEIGRERKTIANSMHDVDQAITVLDRMLLTVAFVGCIFVFIAFLNSSFVTTLATAGTALLSLSFVFSVTCQEFLGSCIFLFVKHPFDIGDRVDINTDQLTVEHISLLFTVFRRVSGSNVGRLVQIPNIVLNTLWIENISRSRAMTEQLSVSIAFDTPFDDIQLLKNELLTFVLEKDNSRDFQPDLNIDVLGTSDMSKLELRVEIRHKSNWANENIRAARRSKFMCALVAALRRVPINPPGGGGDPAGSASNATYTVAIAQEVAQQNKDNAAAAKEAAKLSNTLKEEKATSPTQFRNESFGASLGLSTTQEKAIDDLTSRNVAFDPARDEVWNSREDSDTLGERPSMDIQDQEEIRGLLRRGSTKGRRKPGLTHMQHPGVPTIQERQAPVARTDTTQEAEASMEIDRYEQRRTEAAGTIRSLGPHTRNDTTSSSMYEDV